ncbi:Receptor-like protein kinase HSL1 [Striga hermonthica]|uniref:non-specific serine/threonine protein kinase n=1 Tax=Striga hermonthica TaxID=68872 RepID=A0A9N7MYM6_STRHE|nr:Receptor-like protein kinase HSL1 [Striga hermonthica]
MLLRHHNHRLFSFLLVLLSPPLILCLNQEGMYLQQAKLGFDDPNGALSDWNSGDPTPCNWNGVVCDSSTGSVLSLDLSSSSLSGPFPYIICRLKSLSFVSLYDNFINSTLQGEQLALCRSVEHLNLGQNYLTGVLPPKLADLPNLKYLDLTGNNFSGVIPDSFGTFQKLEVLSLVENLLEGTIPASLGNVSTLKQLNLSYNPFSPGRIPPELGNLTNLEVLWLTETNLVGDIPDSLGRLGRLTDLDLAYNSLTGPIPISITELASVVQLELYNNSLTGELPSRGWSRMKSLRRLDASMNELTGTIPAELFELPLESLNIYENNLRGELPAAIADSPNLYELRLFENQLSGALPPNLGKNSPLRWIDVSTNKFTGEIPEGLCAKGALEELLLLDNSFSGGIPAALAECRSLLRVRLAHNSFSGEIPAGFWGLPHNSLLELTGNSFSGGIANSISGASNLSQLILSGNNFSGSLPEELGFLGNLLEISANDNKLSGSLPSSIVNLGQLVKLDLHNNQLSGELPSGIHSWKKLNELNLARNDFSGNIPDEIGDLSVLNYLDLSGNKFSGKIPLGLQNLKLNRFNVSDNHLTGDIPPQYSKSMYKDSFIGNSGLCGDIEGLCDGKDEVKHMGYAWMLRCIFVFAVLLLIVGLICFYSKYQKFKKATSKGKKSKWTLMSFHKLGFSENEILNALDEDNVIGSGSSGKVYKVVLKNGEAVAVKKLWARPKFSDESNHDLEKGSSNLPNDGFCAEVETLGKIRHKNIVKLWCCCTTRDCKLLVYEYMPNGSLGDLLHSTKSGLLDWPIRFKVAMDAAEGLSYLHHDCAPPIVHRDVKSNNILLDADYGARVADFGVAKAVDVNAKGTKSMSVIAGSCGYIAPEYAYTLRVNEKSDIYSFGVVILELITGKLPVDPEFGEKDLVKWVCTTLDQKGVDHVIDPKLDSCFKDEICRVLNIGLLCTSPLPINRPSMRRVVKMFQEIGCGGSQHKTTGKDGKLTPYYYEDASEHGSLP